MTRLKKLECLGGPVDGARVEDSDSCWFCIRARKSPYDEHYYKRVEIVDEKTRRSVVVWHYHGPDPELDGVPFLKPHRRKFR